MEWGARGDARGAGVECWQGDGGRGGGQGGRGVAWKSSVAASSVHSTKRLTSTTVTTEPEAIASMMARDIPMLPSLKQLSMGSASACRQHE